MDPFVDLLLDTDWLQRCASQHYCFRCPTAVCAHCCPNHRTVHHAGVHALQPAFVGSVGGAPAMRVEDCTGCGFNLEHIQRLVSGQTKWVPITSPPPDQRRKASCTQCGERTNRGTLSCCMACRRLHFGNEEAGAAMVVHLEARAHQFGQPAHWLDTICRVCNRCYCSSLCPDHLRHQGHQDATVEDLVHIHHEHGMAYVDATDIPWGYGDLVQTLELPGRVLYPIHCRPPHQVEALGDPEEQPCHRQGCWEVTHGGALFCSLRCRRG